MIEQWLRPVERIVLSAPVAGARVIGVVSVAPGAGVTSFCRAAAEVIGRAGHKVLLADMSRPVEGDTAPDGKAWTGFHTDPLGFDLCAARATPDSVLRFNSGAWLRSVFTDEFATYETVLVDLPPVLEPAPDRLNPLAAAAACDVVLLVCASGRSSPAEVAAAAEMLRSARARLVGTILNDRPERGRRAA